MANMSYCRFQNTISDFRDCSSALDDLFSGSEPLESRDERACAAVLIIEAIDLVVRVADELQLDVDLDALDEPKTKEKIRGLIDSCNADFNKGDAP